MLGWLPLRSGLLAFGLVGPDSFSLTPLSLNSRSCIFALPCCWSMPNSIVNLSRSLPARQPDEICPCVLLQIVRALCARAHSVPTKAEKAKSWLLSGHGPQDDNGAEPQSSKQHCYEVNSLSEGAAQVPPIAAPSGACGARQPRSGRSRCPKLMIG